MTLPRLKELQGYWAKYPPIHILFAKFVGYEGVPKAASPDDVGTLEDLVAAFQQAGGKMG